MNNQGKVLLINSVCGIRSTGRICTDLAQQFEEQGHQVKIAYGRESVPKEFEKYAVRIGSDFDVKMNGVKARLLDNEGLNAKNATKKFLQWAEGYDPDFLWLHNIHGYYLNYEMLFRWIKSRSEMKVQWTLHDCWTFTGHCAHFEFIKCSKWMKACEHCPQKKEYPASIWKDNSKHNYIRKRQAFSGVQHMTIITPSQWLADLVKNSFLGVYRVEVRYNSIDQLVFRPTAGNIKERLGIPDKKIVLGVATAWGERKGLYDFYRLAKELPEEYQIVLIGLTEKQLRELPEGIIGIQRTNNKKELAELYSAAEVFFNPTYEDTYPTVNLEAEACGTRVITYRTGGAPETISRKDSVVIEQGSWKEVVSILGKNE